MANDYGNWLLVAVISAVFLLFLFDAFKPKNPTDWRTFGSLAAFVVALFAEMYGFPLTIYLVTAWFGSKLPQLNLSHSSGHLWEVLLGNTGDPHMSILHLLSNVAVIGGIILVATAWKVLYQAVQKKSLAATGPYRYIRHPQYAGFILVIVGFLLQWPTIPTLLMAPFLIGRYVVLAKREDDAMQKEHTSLYKRYRRTTPGWLPSIPSLLYGK